MGEEKEAEAIQIDLFAMPAEADPEEWDGSQVALNVVQLSNRQDTQWAELETMRRNLLCCAPGAFVQWMAWYDRGRSHRDKAMGNADFMAALATTRPEAGGA